MAATVAIAGATVETPHTFSVLRKHRRVVAGCAMVLHHLHQVMLTNELVRLLRGACRVTHRELLTSWRRQRQLDDAVASDSPWWEGFASWAGTLAATSRAP